MKDNEHIPVLIIGGGPAGIAASLTLAARNIPHVIADADILAKDKPGECIPPNALPLFKKLGLAELLEHKEHSVFYGNRSVWGSDKAEEKLFLFERHTEGLLLNRSVFEDQLRALSEKAGSRWLKGYSLHSVEAEDKKLNVGLRSKAKSLQLSCDYIVDATGRKASVCRKLGIQKEEQDQLAALDFSCTLTKKIPAYVHTESFDNGWIYAAPAGKNKISAMLFTDPGLLPGKGEREKFITDIIKKTSLIKELLPDPLNENELLNLKIRVANSACIKKPYGDNWLAIGDAAYSYDPVSSYGITSALAGGYYGAHALADTISGKEEAMQVYHYLMESAFSNYILQLHNHYNLEKRWSENPFWKQRMSKQAIYSLTC